MMCRHRRRRANIDKTLFQCPVFPGIHDVEWGPNPVRWGGGRWIKHDNTRHQQISETDSLQTNAGLMLAQRRRLCASIEPSLGPCVVLGGTFAQEQLLVMRVVIRKVNMDRI